MTSSIKISPSILSCNFGKLGEEIKSLEKAGADLIHIDVMDGHFVPNITIGPEVIKKKGPLPIHPEATKDLKKSIELIKKFDKKVGISLNPNSEISLVEPYLNDIDLILVMSVNPGFAGQKFKPEVLKKLEKIKKIIVSKNLKIDLEIDGGISFQNSIDAKNAGANILVSGSTIFNENNGDLKKNIGLLRTD